MFDLNKKLKEYKKFYRLFKKDKLEKNVHLWYDHTENKYLVTVTFSIKFWLTHNFELIK